MRLLVILLMAFSFLGTGCSSKEKKKETKKVKEVKKVAAVEGQLPDHDYQIHQPLETEIMIMIDSRGKAKQIPDEWSVDTTAHKPFLTNKKVAKKVKKKKKRYSKKKKKKKRKPASKKKKKRKKKKK